MERRNMGGTKGFINLIFLLSVLCVFSLQAGAHAGTIVQIKEAGVSPGLDYNGNFPTLGNINTIAGVYNIEIQDVGTFGGFCTEDAWSSSSFTSYALIPIANDGGIYEKAAWIASGYYSGAFNSIIDANVRAAATQLVIWEVVMDTGLNLTTGSIYTTVSYASSAQWILGQLPSNLNSFDPSGWIRAVSPPGSATTQLYQNFIIPTPIPAAAWLLGTGLIGLVALKRRFER